MSHIVVHEPPPPSSHVRPRAAEPTTGPVTIAEALGPVLDAIGRRDAHALAVLLDMPRRRAPWAPPVDEQDA